MNIKIILSAIFVLTLSSAIWATQPEQGGNTIIKLSDLGLSPSNDGYWEYFWSKPQINPADPSTYQHLNHYWSKDSRHVYDRYEPMRFFDVKALAVRAVDPSKFRVLNEIFATDGTLIFTYGEVAKTVKDPSSFQALDEGCWIEKVSARAVCGGYAKDSHAVYFYGNDESGVRIVDGADPSSFRSIGLHYGKDAQRVYYFGERMPNVQPHRFSIIGPAAFARDHERVYYAGLPVSGADPEGFVALGGPYGVDRRHVYNAQERLKGVDPTNFKIPSWVTEKNG